ncbi:MAG TPA: YbhB/YbcL family Raf kinase inhibitor-like protein [Solirubrobacteraceae bacterium]|nr:YbhB/YbcL family Raf kinase inhibitor-like protein [Solirubrobacteraceae bacterium]
MRPEGALPARYTCDGHNQPPPLRWKKVPAGTAELMLDVMKIAPVNGRLFVAWAVAGLKPSLRAIGAGKLPAGAVVGANSLGQASYDLCPPKGPSESYVAVLLALPHKLGLQTGFDGREARDRAIHEATFESSLIFSYQRK